MRIIFVSVYQYLIHPTGDLPRNHKTFNLASSSAIVTRWSKSVIAPQDSVRLESSGRKRISLQFEHILVCALKYLVVTSCSQTSALHTHIPIKFKILKKTLFFFQHFDIHFILLYFVYIKSRKYISVFTVLTQYNLNS